MGHPYQSTYSFFGGLHTVTNHYVQMTTTYRCRRLYLLRFFVFRYVFCTLVRYFHAISRGFQRNASIRFGVI